MKLSELPANCVPSRVLADSVYLIDAGDDRFSEPLYQISLARRCEQGHAMKLRLPLEMLPVITEIEALAAPRGLIAHTGRCGSTLLANMLGTHPAVRMIKEPEALSQVLIDRAPIRAVAAILRAFGRGLPASAAVLVKCTNWQALELGRLLAEFGDTRAIFLWRPAAEVVASYLDQPALWQSWRYDPERRATWFPHETAETTETTEISETTEITETVETAETTDPLNFTDLAVLYAHAWRVSCVAALRARREFADRVKIISYAELRADPGEIVRASAHHFELPATHDLIAQMTRDSARYSKTPDVAFDPMGIHARQQLTAAQRRVVSRIAGTLEADLILAGRS